MTRGLPPALNALCSPPAATKTLPVQQQPALVHATIPLASARKLRVRPRSAPHPTQSVISITMQRTDIV